MTTLTVSLVTADNKKLILDCLRSIYETAEGLNLEIYVVINASSDDSEEAIRRNFPEVRLIVNEKKLGFTHNHNMVMRRAKSEYILVLNDDTVILDGALEKMVDFMEASSDVGVLGCTILNPDRSLQWSAEKSFSHKFSYFRSGAINSIFPFFPKPHFKSTKEVSWVTGACFMVRSQVIKEVGLFDENIVIYFEDADLCYRIIKAGWKVVFYPDAQIIHYYGQTRKKHLARDMFIIYQSRFYFFSKHYSSFTYFLIKLLTILEIFLRSIKILIPICNSAYKKEQRDQLLDAYKCIIQLACTSNSLQYGEGEGYEDRFRR